MWTLLSFGSLAFYLFTGLVFAIITAMLEDESPWWATVMLAGSFIILAVMGGPNILLLTLSDPLQALTLLAFYFLAGAFWSIVKWGYFVLNRRDLYNKHKRDFFQRHNVPFLTTVVPENLRTEFKYSFSWDFIKGGGRLYDAPQVRDNLERLFIWMAYWPTSFVWTMINDPIRKLWNWIFRSLRGIYDTISNRLYKNIAADLEPAKQNDKL